MSSVRMVRGDCMSSVRIVRGDWMSSVRIVRVTVCPPWA